MAPSRKDRTGECMAKSGAWMSDGWMQAAGGVEVEQLFKFGASL